MRRNLSNLTRIDAKRDFCYYVHKIFQDIIIIGFEEPVAGSSNPVRGGLVKEAAMPGNIAMIENEFPKDANQHRDKATRCAIRTSQSTRLTFEIIKLLDKKVTSVKLEEFTIDYLIKT